MKRTKSTKPFLQMTPAERERDVARFDGPIDIEHDWKPLTLRQQLIYAKLRGEDIRSATLLQLKPGPLAKLMKLASEQGVSVETCLARIIREASPQSEATPRSEANPRRRKRSA